MKEKLYLDKADRNILRNEITTIDHALTRPWTVSRFYRRVTQSDLRGIQLHRGQSLDHHRRQALSPRRRGLCDADPEGPAAARPEIPAEIFHQGEAVRRMHTQPQIWKAGTQKPEVHFSRPDARFRGHQRSVGRTKTRPNPRGPHPGHRMRGLTKTYLASSTRAALVTGPSPMIRSVTSSSLAPSQCTRLP